jgi:asparagine synthase (glutamine-hydrolysing)
MSWRSGKISSSTYWVPDFENKVEVSYTEALETTKSLIEAAVERRLISERPLGSFLSGGYDSTVVTAYLSKLLKEKVQTYSIGFNSRQFNEAHHAKQVANYLGTNHHEEILNPDPALVIEKISDVLDQPFADSSIVPTFLLAKFARENLIVALGGDGGDEVFGGYDRYLAAPIIQRINPILGIVKPSISVLKLSSLVTPRKFERIRVQMSKKRSLSERYNSIMSLASPEEINFVLNEGIISMEANKKFEENFRKGELSSHERMFRSDIAFYLPGDLLVKADIASMANSLELRSPLLDVSVVEWGLSLPLKYKINRFETKHILKDVARSLVPRELIDRPKMGFAIPRAEWIRTGMKEMTLDTLTDSKAQNRDWFDMKSTKQLISTHMSGRDLDHIIWPMLMLELWARTWLDS